MATIQLELLLIESAHLVRSVDEGDLDEAGFRARRVGDLAWADGYSAVGNAANNLEVALRDAKAVPKGAHGDLLACLLAELDVVLKPLRDA
jgi:hypothetical protein